MNVHQSWFMRLRAFLGDPVANDEMHRDYFINMRLWKVKHGRLYKVGYKKV